jgi:mono/diheme cytochrome c family protein
MRPCFTFFTLASAAVALGCAVRGGDGMAARAAEPGPGEIRRDEASGHAAAQSAPQPGTTRAQDVSGSDRHARLAEEVRELAKPHCGECHQSSRPTAKAAAIVVFDLDRVDWYATMADHQLEMFRQRSGSKVDRDVVGAFLEAESARRRAAAPEVKRP